MTRPPGDPQLNLHAARAFTVRVPAPAVFAALHDPDVVRRVLEPDLELTEADGGWRARPAAGRSMWRIEVWNEEAQTLGWRCRDEGGQRLAQGTVKVRTGPADEGTEVIAWIDAHAPEGAAGSWLERRDPGTLLRRANEALHRFKALLEAAGGPASARGG